jgi:alkylated DNA repair dioxygenase AlkB
VAAERIELGDGAWLLVDHAWIAPERATDLLRALLEQVVWRHETIVVAGRRVLQPRLTAWYGDADAAYTYSGLTLQPLPWIEPLLELRERLERDVGEIHNSVLVNRYRDGADSMGFHADNEPELGPTPLIASVSLGATRRFLLRRRDKTGRPMELDLSHGGLLVMGGSTQRHFRHGVPKQPAVREERVNLTFRRIVGAPRRAHPVAP